MNTPSHEGQFQEDEAYLAGYTNNKVLESVSQGMMTQHSQVYEQDKLDLVV